MPDWAALRSATATFIFLADPKLDEALYQKTFGLTKAQCEVIRGLEPKRALYIVKPDEKLAKKVLLYPDHMEYALATSTPEEVALRNENIEAFGFQDGLRRTAMTLYGCPDLPEEDEYE